MATLYFLKFNNYYNRIIRRKDSIGKYGYEYSESGTNLNFNPNDGVDTKIVFGRQSNPYNGNCDYCIYSNDNVSITSRWFIVEQKRLMGYQYEVSLHRDVVADYFDDIISAPCFIEKATLSQDNPLIFNSENMTYNQIKQKPETLLKDDTGTNWVVGYMPKGAINDGNEISIPLNQMKIDIDLGNNDIENEQWYASWKNTHKRIDETPNFIVSATERLGDVNLKYVLESSGSYYEVSDKYRSNGTITGLISSEVFFKNANYDALYDALTSELGYIPYTAYNDLLSKNGKIIRYKHNNITTTKRIRFVSLGAVPKESGSYAVSTTFGSTFWNQTKSNYYTGTPTAFYYENLGVTEYSLTLEDVSDTSTEAKVTIPTTRNHLTTSPYDMFIMPNHSIELLGNATQEGTALQVGVGLVPVIGTEFCYDIQLLPYCPYTKSELESMIPDSQSCARVTDQNGNLVTYMFFSKNETFQKVIALDEPIVITDAKVQNECDMYRLVSPNYNGVFEFSGAKNGGIGVFNVHCTYLPQNPYIHVAPEWGGIYGTVQGDQRGLICGGDFSIPRASEAWTEYVVQNKNYQNIFDREIQNMEVKRKYERVGDVLSAVAGGAQGAVSGSKFGVGGAVAGGIASSIAGVGDVAIKETLYNETLDLKHDMFGFQLGNVQALPTSICKTTAYTANNKEYPFLEYYTCTEEEKRALRQKLRYNGMTVGVIGMIKDYIVGTLRYVKGKIIRFNHLTDNEGNITADDFHLTNAIADEINKGVYLSKDDSGSGE